MPSDPLRGVIDTLRSRLQADLEAEFARLADSHEEALERTRRETEAQAEQQWAARLEALRLEMTARVESEVTTVRSEAERRMIEETTRARLDAEQAAAETTAALRREMEQALAAERTQAQAELEAERGRAQSQLEEERVRAQAALEQERANLQAAVDEERAQLRGELETVRGRAREQIDTEHSRALAEVQSERQRAEQLKAEADAALNAERERAQRALAEAQAALAAAQAALDSERQRSAEAVEAAKRVTVSLDTSRLVDSLRAIDEATSLNSVIREVVIASAAEAGRAAFFVINGTQLDEWTAPGTSRLAPGSLRAEGHEAGLLADALRRTQPVASSSGVAAPAFARIDADRQALAVPFLLGGQAVAVLYADEGTGTERRTGWLDAVQIIGRHGAAALAAITARKTVDALRLAGGHAPADDAEQGARRYARLLVSELKLYNEGAVRVGRQMRDLGRRLRPEIDRARQMYSDRVSPTLAGRDTFFQQELVRTLADGDPSLLG